MAHISTLFVGTFTTLLAIGAIQKRTGFRLNRREWIVILLIALSIIGIGVTDFSPAVSHWYWLAMVPVFGLFCILIEWDRILMAVVAVFIYFAAKYCSTKSGGQLKMNGAVYA